MTAPAKTASESPASSLPASSESKDGGKTKELTFDEFDGQILLLGFERQTPEHVRGIKWIYYHKKQTLQLSIICGPDYSCSYRLQGADGDESSRSWIWWRTHIIPVLYEIALVRAPSSLLKCVGNQSLQDILSCVVNHVSSKT